MLSPLGELDCETHAAVLVSKQNLREDFRYISEHNPGYHHPNFVGDSMHIAARGPEPHKSTPVHSPHERKGA